MLTIGRKIKKLRELRNYTQEYMADQLGVSQPAYSKMETDETEINDVRLTQIAKALDVSVQDILAFDERMFFNITNRDYASGTGYTYAINNNYGLGDNEKKLFEDKIRLLEEMIDMLKKENEQLKAGKK